MGSTSDRPPGDRDEQDNDLADLVPEYIALCRRDVASLLSALDEKRFDQARLLGHNFKGSGAAYGFPQITEIGSAIETASVAHDEAAVRRLVEQLVAVLDSETSVT